MNKTPTIKGLAYRALDLHVHTPASKCFQDRQATPEDIVRRALEQRLDGICITDHNSGEWIDEVKKVASETPLTVFPGVEISAVGGKEGTVHVVAIFDIDRTSEHVNDLLSALGIGKDVRGQDKAFTKESPSQVIDRIADLGALAILAHCDSTKGVLNDMKGQPRIDIVRNDSLLGAEVTKDETKEYLDGSDPDYRRRLATYKVSDAHDLQAIGSERSYWKVGALSLGSLRQCLYDPDVRIRSEVEYSETICPRIETVQIAGGFFEGETCSFHTGLTTIIGGKGVGKSLLIEFLRFTLDQSSTHPSLQSDVQGKLEDQLGVGAEVIVSIFIPPDSRYQITRRFDARDNPITVIDSDTGRECDIIVPDLFPILTYSQNEIVYVGEDPRAQLDLIDKFLEAKQYKDEIEELQEALHDNDQKLSQALRAQEELKSLKSQKATLDEHIKHVEESLKSSLFDEMQTWESVKQSLEAERKQLAELRKTIESCRKDIEKRFERSTPETVEAEAEVLVQAKGLVTDCIVLALKNLDELRDNTGKKLSELDYLISSWLPSFNEIERKFLEFLKKSGGDQQDLETERRRLVDQRSSINEEIEELGRVAASAPQLLQARAQLLDRLDRVREAFSLARENKYRELSQMSQGKLLLELKRSQDIGAYEESLARIATGTYVRKDDLGKIARAVPPREFLEFVLSKDEEGLASRAAIAVDTASKLIGFLRSLENQEAVLRVQHDPLPADTPTISYRKEDGKYYPLSALSVGQKCTALVIIALTEGTCPIVIDQPEDALDIASVYEDVVLKLRAGKEHRQFILTTHNANVGVGADPDLIMVLKATASRGQVICAGDIEDISVKDEALAHLEGGAEPYTLRGKKYGILS